MNLGGWVERWISGTASLSTPIEKARFVVVDTETSGLDAGRDRLLSIGACAVRDGRIELATSFYRELRQAQASPEANILVHGIGAQAQLAGDPPGTSLESFLDFAADDPLVAFNAPFDRAFLSSAFAQHSHPAARRAMRGHWFDLAQLPRALFPEDARRRTLDEWLDRFGIVALGRHNALDDAYNTAQLLLPVLARARAEGFADLRGLRRAERLAVQGS